MPRGKKSTKQAKTSGRRGRPPGSQSSGSPTGIVREMEQYRRQLLRQREALDQQLSALDQALRAFGGATGDFAGGMRGGRGGAPRGGAAERAGNGAGGDFRPGSLKDYITRVLSSGETKTVKDISQEVIDSGYKTKNRTLATSVGLALAEMPNVRKVARGTYRLK